MSDLHNEMTPWREHLSECLSKEREAENLGNKYSVPCHAQRVKMSVIMRGTGHTHQEIADEIGVSRTTVANWLKKLKKEAEENGVDETLTRIFLGTSTPELITRPHTSFTGIMAVQIIQDLEWWMNHYRMNAHWMIQRLWQFCYGPEENREALEGIVKSSLDEFAKGYGFNLERFKDIQEKKHGDE